MLQTSFGSLYTVLCALATMMVSLAANGRFKVVVKVVRWCGAWFLFLCLYSLNVTLIISFRSQLHQYVLMYGIDDHPQAYFINISRARVLTVIV